MPTPPPTVDELVSTIQRSRLPTVVVEGKDDVIVYRWMESILKDGNVDFLPCNTRTVVLALFNRRAEFAKKRVAFVADQDMWVFTKPPEEFGDVVFTSGYSIENDVLSSCAADRLFDAGEQSVFATMLECLQEWFAFEASEAAAGRLFTVDLPLRRIIEMPSCSLSAALATARGYRPTPGPIRDKLKADPLRFLRGKNLLDAYVHVLNGEHRASRYSKKAILEICVRIPERHLCCEQIIDRIRRQLLVGPASP